MISLLVGNTFTFEKQTAQWDTMQEWLLFYKLHANLHDAAIPQCTVRIEGPLEYTKKICC